MTVKTSSKGAIRRDEDEMTMLVQEGRSTRSLAPKLGVKTAVDWPQRGGKII